MRGREEDEKDKIALVAKKTQEVSDMAQRNIGNITLLYYDLLSTSVYFCQRNGLLFVLDLCLFPKEPFLINRLICALSCIYFYLSTCPLPCLSLCSRGSRSPIVLQLPCNTHTHLPTFHSSHSPELAIQRGEKIEDLENKSDDLARGANEFNRGAKGIKQMYCRRNLRNNIIIFVIVVTILGLIIWAISK